MARRTNRKPSGSRVGRVFEDEGVALVNRSNIDVECNDPEPPHGLVVWRAGHIDPMDPTRNCVQFFTTEAATAFIIKTGYALEPLSVDNGKLMLAEARKAGSFKGVYERLRRSNLVDLTHLPNEVMARANLRNALRSAGMRDTDIPKDATLADLRTLHTEFTSGRHHLRLVGLENERAEASEADSVMQPLDLSPARKKADDLSEIQLLRGRCDELGVTWHPGWKQARLRQVIADRENALQVAGGKPSRGGLSAEELAQIHAASTPLAGAGAAEGVFETDAKVG